MEYIIDEYTRNRLHELSERAISTFGEDEQMRHVQEECAELIAAINQDFRGRPDGGRNVAEELADVVIMATQAMIIMENYSGYRMNDFINQKLSILKWQLEDEAKEKCLIP